MKLDPQIAMADVTFLDRVMPVDSVALASFYGVILQIVGTLLVLAPLVVVFSEIVHGNIRKHRGRLLVAAKTTPVALLGLCLAALCYFFAWLPWLIIGLFCVAAGIWNAVDDRRSRHANLAAETP